MAIDFEKLETHGQCERCGAEVLKAGCYSQIERHGKLKARAYYCAGCARTLFAVGAGEQTDMAQRQNQTHDNSPETKQDF